MSTFFRHVKGIHLKIKDFKCDLCEYASADKRSVESHRRAVHGLKSDNDDKDLDCEICDKSFGNISSLRRHKLLHKEETPYSCDKCEYASSRRDKLKRHKDTVHVSDETSLKDSEVLDENNDFHEQVKVVDVTSKIKEWVCDMCEFVTSQKISLVEHVHNNHWKNNFAGATADEMGDNENIGAHGSAEGSPSITNDTI